MKKFILFFFLVTFAFAGPKRTYSFSTEPIDVVIPCHPKDKKTLKECIEGIRRNGKNIRNIFVVSKESLCKEAIWIKEDLFPFQKEDLAREISYLNTENKSFSLSRLGWMYQQLLKLYAPFVIPNISSNVLVLDADTIFLTPVSFMNDQGEPLFAWGKEYYAPYFKHAQKLLPSFERAFSDHSGICHHMLLQKPVLIDLMTQIERAHGCQTWQAFCRCIDLSMIEGSAFSEYEIYFHFIFQSTSQAHLRALKWKNTSSLHKMKKHKIKDFHFISCHNYS